MCWCKGSVSERIFLPLVEKIKKAGAKIQGSTFVTDVITDPTGKVHCSACTCKKLGRRLLVSSAMLQHTRTDLHIAIFCTHIDWHVLHVARDLHFRKECYTHSGLHSESIYTHQ